MIRRLLILDGVNAVCSFRDDGALVDGYGLLNRESIIRLAQFAHEYRRTMQSHADQFAMFSGMRGWTPPRGWIVRSGEQSICGTASIVCAVDSRETNFKELLLEMQEIANW